jgi:methyl-accepting chemotaxis protein
MTERNNEVSSEAAQTGQRAGAVLADITTLDATVEELKHSVVRAMRTSMQEVDRRAEKRYPIDLPCQVVIGGQTFSVRLADLSEGGARVIGAPAQQAGMRGVLRLDGFASPLAFSINSIAGDEMGVVFTLDPVTAAAFHGVPERLLQRRAA